MAGRRRGKIRRPAGLNRSKARKLSVPMDVPPHSGLDWKPGIRTIWEPASAESRHTCHSRRARIHTILSVTNTEGVIDMVDILHKVGIKSSSPNDVYKALTTIDGLAGWWTIDTKGDGNEVGGVVRFRFGNGGFDMKVLALEPGKHVLWEVIDGPQEWLGTKISWDIRQEGDWTIILFKHEGWKEPIAFMHHCSTKWGVFLLSLKSLLETGKGTPWPNEIKLDSWE